MISITAEYALRAAAFLAKNPSRAWTTQQIGESTRVPVGYLSKVLQALTRARVILSVRGIYGGYQLARPASETSALDVINAVDPIRRIERCPLGLKEHARGLCPLHDRLDQVIAQTLEAFGSTPLSDVIGSVTSPPDSCAFPRPASDPET